MYKRQEPVRWVMVNRLSGHAYFNHMAHLNRGIGCTSCHGDAVSYTHLDVYKRQFHFLPPDHLGLLSHLLDLLVSQLGGLMPMHSTPGCQPG